MLDIDWRTIKTEKFLFIPKLESKKKTLYFDKTRISETKTDDYNMNSGHDASIHKQIRRDDLLHKKNLEYFNEKFNKTSNPNKIILGVETMVKDMNGEDFHV